MKKQLKRRNAIEPVIGHLKSAGRLSRNFVKAAEGDAINANLCGAGHNLRKILRQLALSIVLRLIATRHHRPTFVPVQGLFTMATA